MLLVNELYSSPDLTLNNWDFGNLSDSRDNFFLHDGIDTDTPPLFALCRACRSD